MLVTSHLKPASKLACFSKRKIAGLSSTNFTGINCAPINLNYTLYLKLKDKDVPRADYINTG